MRVISGLYKGRNIEGFDIDGTRPTQDRVKESVFGSIQDYLDDSTVLDLFSGSGNLAIESLSNGSSKAYLVDNSKDAINIINKNINDIKVENAYVIKDDYMNALNYFKNNNIKFDIIFLDPPYKDDYIDNSIKYLLDNNMINKNGIIVCEFENNIKLDYEEFEIKKEKKFGYKKIVIFKKI